MTREQTIEKLKALYTNAVAAMLRADACGDDESAKVMTEYAETLDSAIKALGTALQTDGDCISRRAAIDTAAEYEKQLREILSDENELVEVVKILKHRLIALPPAQPERNWHSCGEPPKHHKNVLVRGIEAIGNVTVHKVMQWDVDRWRPTDYAPSIVWQEWSEI